MKAVNILPVYIFLSLGIVTTANPDSFSKTFYSHERQMYCQYCSYHTFYNNPCTENDGPSDCEKCPPGKWNPKERHTDTDCQDVPDYVNSYIEQQGWQTENETPPQIRRPSVNSANTVGNSVNKEKPSDKSNEASITSVSYFIVAYGFFLVMFM